MSQSPKTKKDLKFYVDKLVSIGAAVVIVGALFKILHWKFANELLIVGMFTEAAIFLVYAYLPSDSDHGTGGGGGDIDSSPVFTFTYKDLFNFPVPLKGLSLRTFGVSFQPYIFLERL